jgi:uncharacterized protein (TIGR00730 family)
MATEPKPRIRRRPYRTGDDAIDAKIEELLELAGTNAETDLLREMITTCVRMMRGEADRGELKLVNAALKEFAYSFKVFSRYKGRRKVSIFGSSRLTAEDPNYDTTKQFGKAIVQTGWMVITGAGPGIMAAGHEGAGAEQSFGVAIRLPMESEPNMFIEGDQKLINYKYFFTRKVTFLKESDAFVLMPGGFGTLDEAFELLTLMQTGKSDLHPVVLLEEPGGTYWEDWLKFVHYHLVDRGLISPQDLYLLKYTRDVHEAVEHITRFYANYQSQRYVNGVLVLRVLRLPPEADLTRLKEDFSDVLFGEGLRPVEPSEQEMSDNDALELKRLAVDFDRGNFGRLRQLIDALNDY